jgi:hypothetical protein
MPVCPFVPVALDHATLWLPAERSAGRSTPNLIELIDGYKQLLLGAMARDGTLLRGQRWTAIYNPNCRPFTSPVPFLLMRRGVISDWKFFLNNKDWLRLWARRYGEAAVETLADELRRFPWQARGD